MRRVVWRIAAVFSLIAGLGFLVLWPVSYHTGLQGSYPYDGVCLGFSSNRGQVQFYVDIDRWPTGFEFTHWQAGVDADQRYEGFCASTWRFQVGPVGRFALLIGWNDLSIGSRELHTLFVTHWSLVLLAAVLPATWWRYGRRSFAAGHCRQCGYDLWATPQRCPECGHVPVSSAVSP